MKHYRHERGQGIFEFVVGLAILVLLCLAATWLITKFVVLIKDNFVEMNPPTATAETTPAIEGTPLIEIPENTEEPLIIPTVIIQETESPQPSFVEPPIPDAPSTKPKRPLAEIWENFTRWITSIWQSNRGE